MLDKIENIVAITLGILSFFGIIIGIAVKIIRDRDKTQRLEKTQKETTSSISDITGALKVIGKDIIEDKQLSAENNRLITAVHSRLDRVERAYGKLKVSQVRYEERLNSYREELSRLRDTQKLKPIE